MLELAYILGAGREERESERGRETQGGREERARDRERGRVRARERGAGEGRDSLLTGRLLDTASKPFARQHTALPKRLRPPNARHRPAQVFKLGSGSTEDPPSQKQVPS